MKLTIDGLHNICKNKYYKIYTSLIARCKLRTPVQGVYYESHHITPRSLGGTDDSDNIVLLTAREHYIAHMCLVRFVTGQGKYKMVKAAMAMSMTKDRDEKERILSSRLYEANRKLYSALLTPHLLEHSSFKNKETHRKSMHTRAVSNSNPFRANNPMHSLDSKMKKVAKTSGENHYLRKTRRYSISYDRGETWSPIDTSHGLPAAQQALGIKHGLFFKLLNGDIPSRGPNINIRIKREIINNED